MLKAVAARLGIHVKQRDCDQSAFALKRDRGAETETLWQREWSPAFGFRKGMAGVIVGRLMMKQLVHHGMAEGKRIRCRKRPALAMFGHPAKFRLFVYGKVEGPIWVSCDFQEF